MLKKILSRWTVVMAILFILWLIIVAVFCYWMAPDNSSHARLSIPELANLYPGETVNLIETQRPNAKTRSAFHTLLVGQNLVKDYIPYDSVKVQGGIYHIKVFSHGDTTLHQWKNTQISAQEAALVQRRYILGSDKMGRDILSRLMVGSRISLSVGIVAVLLSISIGLLIGSIGGYFGGLPDKVVMWIINVFWAIPTILLVFAIVMALGKGFWQIFIAIGITMWVGPARIVRGQIMSLKQENYVQAARSLGFGPFRIIRRHIVPNIIGILVVLSAANFATAILIEAGLSFLGVGIQPPMTSWGLMVKEQYNYLITDNPVPTLVPGMAIMLSVLSFNILGNFLRDYFDVKSE